MLSREKASRKPLETMREIPENINEMMSKLSTQRRVITPNFKLIKPRYKTGQKLPSFMENVNNRMAITKLSFEMLKANNYSDMDPLYYEMKCHINNIGENPTLANHRSLKSTRNFFITDN